MTKQLIKDVMDALHPDTFEQEELQEIRELLEKGL